VQARRDFFQAPIQRRFTVAVRNVSHSTAWSLDIIVVGHQAQSIQVDAIAAFQIGGGEQMRHQRFDLNAIGNVA